MIKILHDICIVIIIGRYHANPLFFRNEIDIYMIQQSS